LKKIGSFTDADIAVTSESTPGVTGWFEVTVDGKVVHSKKNGEGLPNDDKIAKIVAVVNEAAK